MGIFQSTPRFGVRMTPEHRIASSKKNVDDSKKLLANMIALQTKMRSGYKPTSADISMVPDLPRNLQSTVYGQTRDIDNQFKKLLAYQIKKQHGIISMYSNILAKNIRAGGKYPLRPSWETKSSKSRTSRTPVLRTPARSQSPRRRR